MDIFSINKHLMQIIRSPKHKRPTKAELDDFEEGVLGHHSITVCEYCGSKGWVQTPEGPKDCTCVNRKEVM